MRRPDGCKSLCSWKYDYTTAMSELTNTVLIHAADEAQRESFFAVFKHCERQRMSARMSEKTLYVLNLKTMATAVLLFILAVLIPASHACGQVLNFRNYGVDEGLPDGLVRAMAQDHEGYLWFGTHGGLCRFDGVSIKIYSREDGLDAVHIRALCVDRDAIFGSDPATMDLSSSMGMISVR